MAGPEPEDERRALRRSILVATVLGALGIVWGLATGSQLILLDGAYAFIGVAVSWLLLLASRLVSGGPSKVYPYGREALTPLVVGVQGFVLLGTVIYAAVDAVGALVDGGGEVSAGWALLYAALTTAASLAVWRWMLGVGAGSDLVSAEAAAWKVSGLLGGGMVLAFAAMLAIDGTGWSDVVPYIDPAMVLVTAVVLLPSPLGMVRTTFVELLEGAPPDDVQAPVLGVIAEVRGEYGFDEPVVRMSKVGSKLYVEIDAAADGAVTIEREHQIRCELERRLDVLPFDVWLNFELLPHPEAVG